MTEDTLLKIARVVHEAIRAWQQVNGQHTAAAWEEATWERDGTVEAVRFALANPVPGAQHTRWMEERRAQGWIYGSVKDAEAKTNPALVPFDELPAVEIVKDHLVIGITQAMAAVLEPDDE